MYSSELHFSSVHFCCCLHAVGFLLRLSPSCVDGYLQWNGDIVPAAAAAEADTHNLSLHLSDVVGIDSIVERLLCRLPESSPTSSSSSSSSATVEMVEVERSKRCSKSSSMSSVVMVNPARYKTELCRQYVEHGSCRYGDKCQFAHGPGDLRTLVRHPRSVTLVVLQSKAGFPTSNATHATTACVLAVASAAFVAFMAYFLALLDVKPR